MTRAPLVAGWRRLANLAGPWPRGGGSLPGVSFPVNLVVELQLGGTWTDVTGYVLQGAQVVITRGRPNEAGKVTPSSCTLTLYDPDGRFNPRNPVGAYAGLLGRNTPIRVSAAGRSRFVGEVVTWAPGWDATTTVRTVKVTGAGILRRLTQGRSTAWDPLRRFVTAHNPAAYWPLADDRDAQVGVNAIGGGAPMVVANLPQPSWHAGTLAAWLDAVPQFQHTEADGIAGSTALRGSYPPGAGYNTGFALDLVFNATVGTTGVVGDFWYLRTSGFPNDWYLSFEDGELAAVPPGGPTASAALTGYMDGLAHHVRYQVTQNGGNADWAVYLDGALVLSGTKAALTVQAVTAHLFGEFITTNQGRLATGHHVLWDGAPPPIADTYRAATGYPGETAGERLARLCAEEGVPFTYSGDLADTSPMGPQRPATLLQLLQECADADQGTLSESRTTGGLHYRTRTSMYNQAPALVLDLAGQQVAPPLTPVDDDQATRNQVTVRRASGGDYTAELTTGTLSTQAPPDGVGRYDTSATLNLHAEAQTAHAAGWLLHLGTVDQPRYPQLRADLAAVDVGPTLGAAALDLDLDDQVAVVNATAIDAYDPIAVLARGYTETLDTAYRHSLTFNCQPASGYTVFELGHPDRGRLHTAGSALDADADATTTSLTVATTQGPVWSASTPYDLRIGGERITVTAVAGGASPQTMTVTRSVNGVVAQHHAGDRVELFSRHVMAL